MKNISKKIFYRDTLASGTLIGKEGNASDSGTTMQPEVHPNTT